MILDEFKYIKPSAGTFGLDPRFVQNVFETTEHFQISEYAANMQQLLVDGDPSVLGSIAMENPCVTPLDLFVRNQNYMKDS